MAFSRVIAIGDGTTTQFAVNFALDYLLEADVTCRVGDEIDGSGFPIYRTITFLSTNLVQVNGAVPGVGVEIVFDRTVDKDELRVDYNNGDELDEDNLMTAQKQLMMAVHEVLDGKYTYDASAEAAAAIATAQAAIAVEQRVAVDAAVAGLASVATFNTVANAAAATIGAAVSYFRVLGRITPGDAGGRGMLYKKLGSTPAPVRSWHILNTVGSTYWQLVEKDVNPRMFGAAGDGVADDFTAVQDAIDYQSAFNDGGDVWGVGNDVYKLVVPFTSIELPRGLVLRRRVNLLGHGSASIKFYCDSSVYGIRPLGDNRIIGWKELALAGSTNLASTQSIYHAVIAMGAAYGEQGTVASPDIYTRASNIEIAFNTITSVKAQGSIIQGTHGPNGVYVHHNIFPSNSVTAVAIGFDWGFLGTLQVNLLDQAKSDYNAGLMYSLHPHNLRIEDNYIGAMTMTGGIDPIAGTGIRLSGCYNFSVKNNFIEQVGYAGIFVTGGDCSFEFAPNADRRVACKNIVIEGNMVRECMTWYGIYCEHYPDNVYSAVVATTYTPLFTHDGYEVNTRIVGNHLYSTLGVGSVANGIHYSFARGGLIEDNFISGFLNGISIGFGAQDVKVRNNRSTLAADSGILLNASTTPYPTRIIVTENTIERCGWTTAGAGGIAVANTIRPIIENNHIGKAGEDTMSYGINLSANATLATIRGNIVEAVKAGGIAYVLTPSTSGHTALHIFADNQYEGAGTMLSGIDIIPIGTKGWGNTRARTFVAAIASLSSGITPPNGTWVTGDTVYYIDPITTGHIGTVCTAGGSPGTWKKFGAVT